MVGLFRLFLEQFEIDLVAVLLKAKLETLFGLSFLVSNLRPVVVQNFNW